MKKFVPKKVRMCVDRYPEEPPEVYYSASVATDENPANAPLDVPGVRLTALEMALLTNVKWSNGRVLRVAFMDGSAAQKKEVQRQAELWLPFMSITFAWQTSTNQADIRISFREQGAWSYLGTDNLTIPAGRPTMNFGFMQEGVAVHEFGHALGCVHEHQSPGAGVIPWIPARVYAYYAAPPNNWTKAQVDTNVLGHYSKSLTQFTEWDKSSIMEYPIDAQLVEDPKFAVGWNTELSAQDKAFIANLYPTTTTTPPAPPPATYRRTIHVTFPGAGGVLTVDGVPV